MATPQLDPLPPSCACFNIQFGDDGPSSLISSGEAEEEDLPKYEEGPQEFLRVQPCPPESCEEKLRVLDTMLAKMQAETETYARFSMEGFGHVKDDYITWRDALVEVRARRSRNPDRRRKWELFKRPDNPWFMSRAERRHRKAVDRFIDERDRFILKHYTELRRHALYGTDSNKNAEELGKSFAAPSPRLSLPKKYINGF
ncbi:hypothetical protein B0T24DRAFT_620158 [Lasiosphaeria ovina]|uniref:Uncharacterized protein n=1 Tax=Lasiosphaeria ovina TaxID=92902 RepID=A0AAE0KJE4_9PEZI|nr:hypothetical protein B0T24DRAFT_620158 [Lasiosphaeria ovina]